jgi:hypothetical protein
MVKCQIAAAVPRHAAYDATERTFRLSQKPHVGAELIPIYEMQRDVFGDLDALQSVLNQRSIYDRLDSFNLRDSAAANMRLAASADLVRRERHWIEDESSREIAADLHNKLSRLPLNQASANLLDLQPLFSQRELRQVMQSLVKISQAYHHEMIAYNLHDFNQSKTLLVQQLSTYWKVDAVSCTTKTGRFQKTSLCTASGFGTAPVWYQQSMENGPPRYTNTARIFP